ncbi:VacJ family lipoprotein [Vibrio amylolyticus]|uniref:MlaA family lipoprotein n=1 Tax=Vibrio amylolyticus TaxID=2847292 RepID=UPI0035504EE4
MDLNRVLLVKLALMSVFLTGCATAPDDSAFEEDTSEQVNDPFEGFNRAMWTLNFEYLDPYLVRPTSMAYVNYVPSPVRTGVANFLSNLDEPSSMVNNLVMGNGGKALDHFNRFWLNSTIGLLGLIDIASEAGITKHGNKAASDAIGHYGVGNGPYVMVPAYGPWTVREATDVVDGLYVPLSYLNIWAALGKWALEGLESRARLASQESLLDSSPDPYALTRDIYIQHQDFRAEIGTDDYDEEEEDFLDDYLDEEF